MSTLGEWAVKAVIMTATIILLCLLIKLIFSGFFKARQIMSLMFNYIIYIFY